MTVNWGALQQPNVLGALQQGMEYGREVKRRSVEESALAAYAQNPDDPQSVNALLPVNPGLGMRLAEQQQARARQTQVAELAPAALNGDQQAQMRLWGIDPDLASKFDARAYKRAEEGIGAIGNAAFRIAQLPEEQRPQAWDEAVGALSQQFPELGQYRGRYSPQSLNAILDQTGMTPKLQEATRPSYMAVPAGGTLVNTRDPAALSGVGSAPAQVDWTQFKPVGGAPSQGGAPFP